MVSRVSSCWKSCELDILRQQDNKLGFLTSVCMYIVQVQSRLRLNTPRLSFNFISYKIQISLCSYHLNTLSHFLKDFSISAKKAWVEGIRIVVWLVWSMKYKVKLHIFIFIFSCYSCGQPGADKTTKVETPLGSLVKSEIQNLSAIKTHRKARNSPRITS